MCGKRMVCFEIKINPYDKHTCNIVNYLKVHRNTLIFKAAAQSLQPSINTYKCIKSMALLHTTRVNFIVVLFKKDKKKIVRGLD